LIREVKPGVALDTYSKLLVVLDLLAIAVLTRYSAKGYMVALFALLILIVWVWLYRLFVAWTFRQTISIAFLAGLGLYFPNTQVRAVSLAFVIPAVASAALSLFGSKAPD